MPPAKLITRFKDVTAAEDFIAAVEAAREK
jgi:hypothetical protein